MFHWQQQLDPTPGSVGVTLGFTDRSAGRGADPFAGLNLGGAVGDDPQTVRENRDLVATRVGVDPQHLLFLDQVHGTTVAVADGPWDTGSPTADAVVTSTPGLGLAVLVADCTPVLLYDARAGVAGAVHAGRPGMTAGVVPAAVRAMMRLGASDISAVVGPSVCGRCYEVPAPMAAAAAEVSPASMARSWTGTPAIDVAAGVVEQLAGLGVAVTWVPGCSRESALLYSYRRDGRTGRYAGVVAMTPRLQGERP